MTWHIVARPSSCWQWHLGVSTVERSPQIWMSYSYKETFTDIPHFSDHSISFRNASLHLKEKYWVLWHILTRQVVFAEQQPHWILHHTAIQVRTNILNLGACWSSWGPRCAFSARRAQKWWWALGNSSGIWYALISSQLKCQKPQLKSDTLTYESQRYNFAWLVQWQAVNYTMSVDK